MNGSLKGILRIVMALSLALCCLTASAQAADGTYIGTAQGMGVVTVTLTVEGDKITQAVVDTDNETENFGLDKGSVLAEQIIVAQSADIDGVSGCTVTSSAARAAAQQALQEAGIGAATSGTMIPGIYKGSAFGHRSTVTVAVEVSGDAVTNIWPIGHEDTPYVADAAIEGVSEQIIRNQSLSVDTMTGATVTSNAAILAVSDALGKAGANTSSWYRPVEKPVEIGADQEYDVVVVGSGPAGLTAALSAKTNRSFTDKDSGLNVLVIEKNCYAGGTMSLNAATIGVFNGTPINDATGVSVTGEEMAEAWESINAGAKEAGLINESVIRKVVDLSGEVVTGLMNRGWYISITDGVVGSLAGEGGETKFTTCLVADPINGIRCNDDGYEHNYASPYIAESLADIVRDAGVEIRLNTNCDSLIVENGVLTGIQVTGENSSYRINAKKVILCTGCSDFSAETVAMFYPEHSGVVNYMCGGNTSDAPKWIVGMGGEASVYAEGNVIIPGYACGLGHFWEEGLLYSAMHTVWVDSNGRRFMNEGELPQVVEEVTEGGEEVYSSAAVHSSQGPARGRAMLRLDKPYAYMIFDANHEGVRFYDRLAQFGIAWRADSLEQLSDMTGISAQDLKATIEKYNADYENGNDTVFGTSHETMAPVISAPYYAVKVSPVSVQGNAAVFVDDDMTVLMKNHGERIENLYAAGGAACNSFYNSGTGTHMGTALTSGAYAGENAREAILGK